MCVCVCVYAHVMGVERERGRSKIFAAGSVWKTAVEIVVIQRPGEGALGAAGGGSSKPCQVTSVDPCWASVDGRRGSLFLEFAVVGRRGSVG